MLSFGSRTVPFFLRSLRCLFGAQTPHAYFLSSPSQRRCCSWRPLIKQNGGNATLPSSLWQQNGKGWHHSHLKHQYVERGQMAEFSSNTTCDASAPPPCSYAIAKIRCSRHIADLFSETLLCFGATSASIDEQDIDDPGEDDEIYVCSIFATDQDVERSILLTVNSMGLEKTPRYEIVIREQYDWTKEVQDFIHPYEVTRGLWIVPEGRDPPDILARNIILNPGMAFGTGEHPTTKMCLLMLHDLIKGGERVLDYGTGSGILGISAVKMGASLSVGIDINPVAILTAYKNLYLNGISQDKLQFYLADRKVTSISPDGRILLDEELISSDCNLSFRKGEFDIVVANIILNSLIELSEEIVSYGKPGAVVGISGILSEQVEQIQEVYSNYLENISTAHLDGWACLSGTVKVSNN